MSTPLPPNTCPRRRENFTLASQQTGQDVPRGDDTCPYCGSLTGKRFISLLEEGQVAVIPTDKNYKVYVETMASAEDRAAAKARVRTEAAGKAVLEEDGEEGFEKFWKTYERDYVKGVPIGKFYFQHLEEPEMIRFVEIYNEKRINFGFPGYFYNLPFFMRYVEPSGG